MRVLMPLPVSDFDPTESAIPWRVLTSAGHEVVFATPDGTVGAADDRMVTGRGLGPWRGLLRAHAGPRAAYAEMIAAAAFQAPLSFEEAAGQAFDGLVLCGGHAPGMKPYLESETLHRLTAAFFAADKPVGAICHGTIVVARAKDPKSGRPVLEGRRSTALPRNMELSAWLLTVLWLGAYYRTYPQTVQAEVTAALGADGEFEVGPNSLLRDTPDKLGRGFVVLDGNYLSARWPGDAHLFSNEFSKLLTASTSR